MLDTQSVTALVGTLAKSLGTNYVYLFLVALTLLDVLVGLARAVLEKVVDPAKLGQAGKKVAVVTASVLFCMVVDGGQLAFSATSITIIGSIAASEVASIARGCRLGAEAADVNPFPWLATVTSFMQGIPSDPAQRAIAPPDPLVEPTSPTPANLTADATP